MKTQSIQGLANQIMNQYDHNRNGVIELRRPEGLWNKLKNADERVRSNTQVSPSIGDNDSINISSQVYTRRDLFFTADKDGNGQVTRDELVAELTKADTNKDGNLVGRGFFDWLTRKPKGELDKFNDNFGEKLVSYSSVDL